MSVIIRLQNLPWTANALDIRRFFNGLHIPDGGVHIVGGEKGDAFIAFANDDDARQAMLMDGGRLSDCNIKLYLSSKTEMQNVINVARGGGGPAVPGEDTSAFGRSSAGNSSSSLGGQGSLMGQQSGYGNMSSEFASQGRQNQSTFNTGGTAGQYGRGNESALGNFGDGRQQNRLGGFGSQSQNSTTSNSQGFQAGQGSWERPMQQGHSSSGGEFGANMTAQQQQGQIGGYGVRDTGYAGRDGNRESSYSGQAQYSSGSDIGRQPANYGGASMNVGASNFNRESQGSIGGHSGGGTLVGNMSSGFGNMARDSQKGDSFMDISSEENIFLQPRDQSRSLASNIFLQGRDQSRVTSASVGAFSSSVSNRNFSAESSQAGSKFGENLRGRYPESSPNTRFHDNNPRSFQDKSSFSGPDMNAQMGFQERGSHGFDSRQGFNKEGPGGFSNDNRQSFNENRGNFGSDGRPNSFGVDSRRDDRRGSRRDYDVHIIINNMPIKSSYRDIRRFFGSSSEIIRDGVKLINDKYGQRVGKAFVKFASEQDCRNALRRNNDLMDGKPVTIHKCSVTEYDKSVDSFQPPPEARRPVDRREMSRDTRDYVHRAPSPKRERFPSPKSHSASPKVKPRDEPRAKPPVKKESESPVKPKGEPRVVGNPNPPAVKRTARSRSRSPPKKKHATDSGENCCILLKNLPFKAQKHDIKKFFGSLKVAGRGGPYFEVRNDGKHTGTAFVQFETAKEAKDAMRNDGKPLNGRSVEMVPISKREFEENVSALRSGTPEPKEKIQDQNGDNKADGDMKFYCIKMKGLPFSANNQTVRDFFEGLEIANRGIHIVYNSQRQAAGTAFVEFVTARDCKKAQDKHKSNMGKRYILIEPITKKEMLEQLQKEQERQRDPGTHAPPSLMDSINFLSNLGNFGGNVNAGNNRGRGGAMGSGDNRGGRLDPVMVQLQNLPFKATESDILAFFRGYGPVRSSLKIDQRDGKPSGKAVLGFHNMEQQQRAMDELNKKHMMGRPIHIHSMDKF